MEGQAASAQSSSNSEAMGAQVPQLTTTSSSRRTRVREEGGKRERKRGNRAAQGSLCADTYQEARKVSGLTSILTHKGFHQTS